MEKHTEQHKTVENSIHSKDDELMFFDEDTQSMTPASNFISPGMVEPLEKLNKILEEYV